MGIKETVSTLMELRVSKSRCVSYLLLCNKLPQKLVFKTTINISEFLWIKNLGAAWLSGSGSGPLKRLQWYVNWSCHLKAWLRLAYPLPRLATHGWQVGAGRWWEVSVLHVRLSMELLECPHGRVTGFWEQIIQETELHCLLWLSFRSHILSFL